MKKIAYLFTSDLRLSENIALNHTCDLDSEVSFIYLLNFGIGAHSQSELKLIGDKQRVFVWESLSALSKQLTRLGHRLILLDGCPEQALFDYLNEYQITNLVMAKQVGSVEHNIVDYVEQKLPDLVIAKYWQNTLFDHDQIQSFDFEHASFSKFRKFVEKNDISVSRVSCPIATLKKRPALSANPHHKVESQKILDTWLIKSGINKALAAKQIYCPVFGGEEAANHHLQCYLDSGAITTYKLTRNELDGWDNSTKFSPFLAVGNISPRRIWWAVEAFEKEHVANESTYWVKFELLWREYFHWLAVALNKQMFICLRMNNELSDKPIEFELFKQWCSGDTDYPIVNAIMKQLNTTGYISNRGRQVVASCFVNELGLDWRYGAAYFQQQLIDHDVASNWGNWRYIAGVGADPRGGRHFNLEKQTNIYDPLGDYIAEWGAHQIQKTFDSLSLDSWSEFCGDDR